MTYAHQIETHITWKHIQSTVTLSNIFEISLFFFAKKININELKKNTANCVKLEIVFTVKRFFFPK